MRREDGQTHGSLPNWVLPLFIAASYGLLSAQSDLRFSLPTLLGTTAFIVSALAVLLYAGEREQLHLSPGLILSFALFFRLLFVFRAPELSDDIYRYLWDGLQTLRGVNPYVLPPAAAGAYDPGSAALLPRINHPDLFTIYPPVSQMVFAAGAAISRSVAGVKIVLVALDMATCFLILGLLRHLKLPSWRAALYAWHPIPVIEIAGSGHIDGAGILFFLVTTFLVLSKADSGKAEGDAPHAGLFGPRVRSFLAGFAWAASILVKLVPVIYLPTLLYLAWSRRVILFFGLVTGLVLFCLPFLPDLSHMVFTLGTYLQHWEFSNFLFRMLRNLTGSGWQARVVLACLFVISVLCSLLTFRIKQKRTRDQTTIYLPLEPLYAITFAFLLLTPTFHPWYALYLVALLPFAAGPAGLVLSWAVFLSYGVLIDYALLGQWTENDLTTAAVWFSPVIACLLSLIARRMFKGR